VKISAVIIAGNEEANIADAVRSVSFADEVIVVDSESTDRTREIAELEGARVIVRPWSGFATQKQFATDSARNDWILSVDADERVPAELADELCSLFADGPPRFSAYRIPRLTRYLGREIRHSGWFPDWQTRLFDRRRGKWLDVRVHESFILDEGSESGALESHLDHLGVDSVLDHNRLVGERYARLAAEQMFADGKDTDLLRIALAGPAAFVRSYFLKLGVLDGVEGLAIARFAAHHAFLKHMLLLQMRRKAAGGATAD